MRQICQSLLLACSLLASNVPMDTMATGGLRVLPSHTDTPIVAQTTVEAASLHTLKVFTKRLVQEVRVLLAGLAILDIPLTVEHPSRNLELQWVADHSDNFIDLISGELTGAL